ncbi:MAG: hypothetical protein Q9170_005876 [Blastenia crenularia]
MAENPPTQHIDSEVTSLQSCTGSIHTVDVLRFQSFGFCALTSSVIAARSLAFEPAGGPRTTIFTKFFGRTYSATIPYDEPTSGSFTIVLSASTCAESIFGNFENPQTGLIEHNATLSSVYQSLVALDQDALFKYTVSSLQKSISTLEAVLRLGVCRGGDRALLPRLQPLTPQNATGWTFSVVPLVLGFGIGLAADFAAIAHIGPFANFSPVGQSLVVAASATLITAQAAILSWMKKKGWASFLEAFVYNTFVVAPVNFAQWAGQQTSTCLTSAQLQVAMDQLAHDAAAGPGPLLLGPGTVADTATQAQATGVVQGLQAGSVQAMDTTINIEP